MADPEVSVSPYWELTFDADGDADGRELDRLLAEVPRRKVRDLIVFAHGWNNDRSGATRLYSRFFEPVPGLAPNARLGYVGVVWPSMRFSDEPIPAFPRPVAAQDTAIAQPVLDKNTRHALLEVFPGRATVVEQIARLLDQQPDEGASLEEFGRLVRLLVEVRPQGPQRARRKRLRLPRRTSRKENGEAKLASPPESPKENGQAKLASPVRPTRQNSYMSPEDGHTHQVSARPFSRRRNNPIL